MAKLKLIFSVFGEWFIPDNLTKTLNIQPSSAWLKWEEIKGYNKKVYRKETAWEYVIGYVEKPDLNYLTQKFLKKFKNKVHLLHDFTKSIKLVESQFDIIIVISKQDSPGVNLEKDFLRFASQIWANIQFDIYVNNE